MKKLLSILSIASITTILCINPLWAKPINYRGEKGTYTIDYQADTYRGCLKSSGCIFLGRKYLVPCKGIECETKAWKKGQYVYATGGENELFVSKNGQLIFHDYLSIAKTSSKSRRPSRSR
jgi:hypothetical protein